MYILDTDASNYSIRAVLSQRQDGEERAIAYASKSLSRAKRNYSPRNVGCRILYARVPTVPLWEEILNMGESFCPEVGTEDY